MASSHRVPFSLTSLLLAIACTTEPGRVPATVSVTSGDSVLIVQDTLLLGASVLDASGTTMVGIPVSWSSSVPAVATVSSAGLVSAVAPGTTIIAAAAGAANAQLTIDVVRPSFTSIAMGDFFSCALTPAGIPWCWGTFTLNSIAATWYHDTPTEIPGAAPLRSLTAGNLHACGLTADGSAWCWGRNREGQLGTADTTASMTPRPVSGGLHFTQLLGGESMTCGLVGSGATWCWGRNTFGSLSTLANGTVPVQLTGAPDFQALFGGLWHTCGITSAGASYCWGSNVHSQLGLGAGAAASVLAPTLVTGGGGLRAAAGSNFSNCALDAAGRILCWGDNTVGELGDGTQNEYSTPHLIPGSRTFQSVSGNANQFCARSGAEAWCWGNNANGELGDGTQTPAFRPVRVKGSISFRDVAVGYSHGCGLSSRGMAYCWGWNLQGQLGTGSQSLSLVPVAVINQP